MSKAFLRKLLLYIVFWVNGYVVFSQNIIIIGHIKDKQSDEPLPFSSARFKTSGHGALTDALGRFLLNVERRDINDSLIINSVGYKPVAIWAGTFIDSTQLLFKMEVMPSANEAIVKTKYSRSLWFWNKIIKNKPLHEKQHWNNYSYEIYNKLEVDIENLNTKKLNKNSFIKPLNFVFNYIDSTSEDKPFLPAYITETLSDYYYQKEPHKAREIIKASRTNGIDNESIVKQLGGLYQNINIYDNYIPVFNRDFIGPFNTNGANYYHYKLLDTQYLANRRLIHMRISPKHKGDDVFEGDCWVHDSTFSIQKITLRPSTDANINFLSGLSIIQEFKLINDTTWFLYKDKFVADISPIGGKNLSLKGRKTTTYKNVLVDSDSIFSQIGKSKVVEGVELVKDYMNESDTFWASHRHEELNKSEKSVYKLLDTLEHNKTYVRYRNTVNFLATGIKDLGNFRIGPWFYWVSSNPWEGVRSRFDFSTNRDFSNHWYFHGYGAYGFGDKKFKEKGDVEYLFSREPWIYLKASYKNDLDNGQIYYDQFGTDNLFASLFRRPNVPFKFLQLEEKTLEYFQETNHNYSFGLSATSKQFTALKNLPSKDFFTKTSGDPFNSFEATFKFRYAYAERTIKENFSNVSLGSDRPIIQFNYTHAFKNVLNSSYDYDKLDVSMNDYFSLAPYGGVRYNLFAGKVIGTAPYNFLQIIPGNEVLYYNRYAFNLLNRYELIADNYAGFFIEHKIGSGFFKYIPLIKRLKWRQFWDVKGVVGSLSSDNEKLNYVGKYPYTSMNGKMYMELGTGIDNILKVFRVDFVWRVLNQNATTQSVNRFGIFGSFHFTF